MFGRVYQATWGRAFASVYDAFLSRSEEAGLGARRAGLLAQAHGRTLELGAGTGLNLERYPDAVSELVLTEPDPHMARRLRSRVGRSSRSAEVIEAPAERLPFPDASFDTVTGTLVLCTVPSVEASLAEVARVLRPGGHFLFLEHVRSDEPRLARWQDRLHGPWKVFGAGCNCNRRTLELLRASPLELAYHEPGRIPKLAKLVEPMVVGTARRPA